LVRLVHGENYDIQMTLLIFLLRFQLKKVYYFPDTLHRIFIYVEIPRSDDGPKA